MLFEESGLSFNFYYFFEVVGVYVFMFGLYVDYDEYFD